MSASDSSPAPSSLRDEADAIAASSDAAPSSWMMRLVAPVQQRLDRMPRYRLARRLYVRYPDAGAALFLFGGFGWDALTLQRIDAVLDNAIYGTYLVLLGVFVFLTLLDAHDRLPHPALERLSAWFPGLTQFFAGGLFSAYVIYFSRSAAPLQTFVFVALLVALLLANEFFFQRLRHTYALTGLYFLATFCFLAFFLPVITGRMGQVMFILSGLLSLAVVAGLLWLLRRQGVLDSKASLLKGLSVSIGLFVLLNGFYVANWIPPVPLAMRAAGIYQGVERDGDVYRLRYERPPWHKRLWPDDTVRYVEGEPVYCFAAVFAPTALRTEVVHHWQRYDARRETWTSTDRIDYRLTGGRFQGFRGFTFKQHLTPGDWRVDVETGEGQLISRVAFTLAPVPAGDSLRLHTKTYE